MLNQCTLVVALTLLLAPMVAEGQEAARRRLDVANNLFKAEAYKEAIVILDDLIDNKDQLGEPTKARVYALRGFSKWSASDQQGAYVDMSMACEIQSKIKGSKETLIGWAVTRASMASSLNKHRNYIEHLDAVLEIDPTNVYANNGKAWLLATCSDPELHDGLMAIHFATVACATTKFDNPLYLDTLAAAFARAGRYEKATLYQERTMSHAKFLSRFKGDELKSAAKRLGLYKAKTPYQEPRPKPAAN